MKKKSLLILPVLLLALAACNKEEEVEEPEDNTPTVTEPTEPSDTSEDEKEDEKEDLPPVVIDERISVADGTASLTDTAQENATCSTYRNLSDLSITSVSEDEVSGDITYTLSGTASAMNDEQADVFWLNVAKPGDAYIVLTIKLEIGDVLTWGSNEVKYADAERTGEEDMIIRISGDQISEERKAGTATYTITDAAGESVKHIVDFSGVTIVDARVTLTSESVSFSGSEVPFENSNSLYISSMSEDASGNVTYYVAGTPNLMTLCQEEAFQVTGAAGSAYVVLTVTLESDETVSYNGKTANATEDVIVRLVNYTDLVFAIAEGEPQAVTHTVVFSNLVQGLRVTLTPGEVDRERWTNDPSLSLSATKGEDGNYTYALSGNLSKMTPCQAGTFGAGASENDEYVLLTVFLQSGETVTWGTEINEEKTRCYGKYPHGMDVVLKVTSEGASSVIFTINDFSEGSVDHIIDLSAYVTPAVGA